MRAPHFWWLPKPNRLASLLSPLGWIYGAITLRRMAGTGEKASIPVICIGNFTVGGAGKTPTAIALGSFLQSQGERPFFLSRGYGGALKGPCLVDLALHRAQDVGDEALLLARVAPTIIGADRVASSRLAKELGGTLIVLDDGLQNPQLSHDFRLAVVDCSTGTGNGLSLPAGPLRAPLAAQMATVSAVLFVGERESSGEIRALAQAFGKPCLQAHLVPEPDAARFYARQRLVAFAGIGLPGKFKATLEALGAEVVHWHAFADHHVFAVNELRALQAEAAQAKALLVTTEKDFVRFASTLSSLNQSLPLPAALPVTLSFDDMPALTDLLQAALRARLGPTISL